MENPIQNIIADKIFFTCLNESTNPQSTTFDDQQRATFERCTGLYLTGYKISARAFIDYVTSKRVQQAEHAQAHH